MDAYQFIAERDKQEGEVWSIDTANLARGLEEYAAIKVKESRKIN